MPGLGVNIAIIKNDQILLTQREDFEVWCLPGGAVDVGESVAQAAIREAREETGLEVALTGLVGVYSRPNWHNEGSFIVSFTAKLVGGELNPQPDEVIEARFYDLDELPVDLLTGQLQRIKDAKEGVGGSVAWLQSRRWLFKYGINRQDVYRLRDRSELSRKEFYRQYMQQPGPHGDYLEIGSNGNLQQSRSAKTVKAINNPSNGSEIPFVGVNVAIIRDGKILLSKREDYDVWCLPGGGVNDNESVPQAALRETREEIGLDVKLTRLIGVYSEPYWYHRGLHVIVYAAEAGGETLAIDSTEVVDADYFGLTELPDDILFGHRQRAIDALNGIGGSASWLQNVEWPFNPSMSRQEIYRMRDQSGLSRLEFYQRYFSANTSDEYELEVG